MSAYHQLAQDLVRKLEKVGISQDLKTQISDMVEHGNDLHVIYKQVMAAIETCNEPINYGKAKRLAQKVFDKDGVSAVINQITQDRPINHWKGHH